MPWALSDITTAARNTLQDGGVLVGERYDDPQVLEALNMAFTELYRLRPDAFVATIATAPPFYVAADDLTLLDFPVHAMYANPI
ncbi:MAG: hypothetical protein GWP74_16870, partial [Proteobacteria bacterium]|nr:hypothetical protein [Pseudomonadota bacterium]